MSDWRSDLGEFLGKKQSVQQERDRKEEANRALVSPFIEGKVLPAFIEVAEFLNLHGRRAKIDAGRISFRTTTIFEVYHGQELRLDYRIEVLVNQYGAFARATLRYLAGGDAVYDHFSLRSGERVEDRHEWNDSVRDITQDDIRRSLIEQYKRRV